VDSLLYVETYKAKDELIERVFLVYFGFQGAA
jgi:hypothetical protein